MKLVHDVPGSRLTLAGEPKPIHPLLIIIVAAFVLPFFAMPFLFTLAALQGFSNGFGGVPALIGVGIALLFSIGILKGLINMKRNFRRVSRIDANLAAGEIRIGMSAVVGSSKREDVLSLARLRSATLRRIAVETGKKGKVHLELRTRREGEDGALDTRVLDFEVEELDRNDEVADLALRLGAAAGLAFHKVVRNDHREVEVELAKEPQSGFAQTPWDLGVANYASDVVAPAARGAVAEERVAAFDPAQFKSEHRVLTWTPGTLVSLRKPFSYGSLGCLPFTLLLLAGPVVFFTVPIPELLPKLVVTFMATIFGLIFGGAAVAMLVDAPARRTEIDWRSRVITLKSFRKTVEIPFETVRAIELKAVHHISKGKNSTTHYYYCEIRALLRGAAPGVDSSQELVKTERFREQPDEPYRMALPLATELAKALGVERRFVDYD
jgi:hypothetical protein